MNKITLSIFLSIIMSYTMAQTNYFEWEKEHYSNANILDGTSICFDGQNRMRFVATSTNKISVYNGQWIYTLLPSSTQAREQTNLKFYNNKQYYIGVDDRIHVIEWNGVGYVESTLPTTPLYSKTKFEINNGFVYYIDKSSRRIKRYSISTQNDVVLTMLSSKARQGSNIGVRNGVVFYVDLYDRLCKIEYSNGNWTANALSSAKVAVGNGGILLNPNSNKVFYINKNDNKIYNYVYGNTSYTAPLNLNGLSANTNSSLLFYSDVLIYQDLNNNPSCFYWRDTGEWMNYTLSSASSINPNFCGFYANDDKVYYESQGNVTERIFFNHKVDFPYVKSTRIYNNGQKYKPLLVNYMTQFCTYDDQSYFFAPHGHYDNNFNDGYDLCGTAAQNFCPAILQDHLADVKSLGFDGVRFNGPELKVNSSGVLCVKLLRIHEHSQGKTYKTEHLVPLSLVKHEFIAEIKNLIDVCAMNGLKVNLFSGVDNTYHHGLTRLEYIAYLEELADELKLYDNLIAYTVALEPDLHFWDNDPQRDLQAIEKSALCSYYDDLYSAVKAKDPNHLITIGFSEMTTVLNYDPAVLKADFFTLHPYSSDRISIGEKWKRSVLWFSKSMKKLDKPWIIGESGAVGRDHSEPVPHGYGILGGLSMVGTEQQQTTYAIDAMNKTFGCGSCAFTWWSYKDFYWHKTNQTSPPSLKHTDFFGLYSHLGDEKNIIQSNVFNTYYPVLSYNNCAQPSNYYESPITNASYTYTGTIKDDNGVPIEDAIVIGLNYIYSTNSLIERNIAITNAQGEYKLYSDSGFNTLRVSALGKEFVDEIGTLSTSNHKITSLSTINCSLLQSKVDENLEKDPDYFEEKRKSVNREVMVYPNPSSSNFKVTGFSAQSLYLSVYSNKGELMHMEYLGGEEKEIEIQAENWPSGNYVVVIASEIGVQTAIFIKS